jgi:glycosyltransferase involved in cell wall biosynthesis
VYEAAPWDDLLDTEKPKQRNIVYFPGFRQIEELPQFYAHAGCFIHPALTEPWGLVVNEAMACGLPVLVSNQVGCSRDLVQEGGNGFTFDPGNVDQLAELMKRVADPGFARNRMGEESSQIINSHGPKQFAEGLEAAAHKALEVGPVNASVVDRLVLEALCRLR